MMHTRIVLLPNPLPADKQIKVFKYTYFKKDLSLYHVPMDEKYKQKIYLDRLIFYWFFGIQYVFQCNSIKLSFVDVCYTVIFSTL